MTTVFPKEQTRAVCGKTSTHHVLGSANTRGLGSRYAACSHGSVDSGRARAVLSALWLLRVGHMSSHGGICAPP